MTEIEKKALALVNATFLEPHYGDWAQVPQGPAAKALIRAIEQHETFRQKVSDAAERAVDFLGRQTDAHPRGQQAISLARFIIQPVDPLVEAIREASVSDADQGDADRLRTALAARGGRIVFDQPEGGAA